MQPDRRTESKKWCWVYGTRDTEKYTDMQQDRSTERTDRTEWCWYNRTGGRVGGYRYAAR